VSPFRGADMGCEVVVVGCGWRLGCGVDLHSLRLTN